MSALKKLNAQEFERLKVVHPNFPIHAIPVPKFKDKTANELTKSIVHFININGGIAERRSNTGRYIKGESVTDVIGIQRTFNGKYIPGTGTNGTADISATIKGRSCAIEVKIGRDRQSQNQIEYQRRIESAGGLYFIAKDFEGFYAWWLNVIELL